MSLWQAESDDPLMTLVVNGRKRIPEDTVAKLPDLASTRMSQVLVTARTNVTGNIYNGRLAERLITLLNELDGLVRPWIQSAFKIGVAAQ